VQQYETLSTKYVHDVTPYKGTSDYKGEGERTLTVLEIFKEDSGKYIRLVDFTSLNNRTSRVCEASVEAIALDRAPLISRSVPDNPI